MLAYKQPARKPGACKSLTGLSIAEFKALVARFRHSLAIHSQSTRAIAGIVNWRFDQRLAAQAA